MTQKFSPEAAALYSPKAVLAQTPCHHCGKSLYESRHSAKSEIRRLERDACRRGAEDGSLLVYRCPDDNGWHIAHSRSQGQRTGKYRDGRRVSAYELESIAAEMRARYVAC